MRINSKKRLAFKSGFTLIELIVTMGIIGIVLATAYSMELFGNKTFKKGSAKSDIQSNIRLAANYITKELRYSSNVTILATVPSIQDMDTDNTKEYIYIDPSNGVLKHHSGGKTDSIVLVASNNISTALKFQQQDYQTVYFKLNGNYKNETYPIDSSVLLLNGGSIGISGDIYGGAICFSQGVPRAMDVNIPVDSITISGPTTVSTSGGTYAMTKKVLPEDASVQSVTWTIDQASNIASINQNGILAVSQNVPANTKITITALANDGSGKSGYFTVTTVATVDPQKVTGIIVKSLGDVTSVSKKTTLQMSVDISPSNAVNKNVIWSISSGTAATINASTGLLQPKSNGNGKVTVKATAIDGSGIYGTKDITITSN